MSSSLSHYINASSEVFRLILRIQVNALGVANPQYTMDKLIDVSGLDVEVNQRSVKLIGVDYLVLETLERIPLFEVLESKCNLLSLIDMVEQLWNSVYLKITVNKATAIYPVSFNYAGLLQENVTLEEIQNSSPFGIPNIDFDKLAEESGWSDTGGGWRFTFETLMSAIKELYMVGAKQTVRNPHDPLIVAEFVRQEEA